MQKKHIYLIIVFIVFLLIFFWFLKPVFIELYCTNQVKKIVGGQWGKLYGAEGYEKKYVNLKEQKNYVNEMDTFLNLNQSVFKNENGTLPRIFYRGK